MKKPKVRIIATGGTIGSVGHDRMDFVNYPATNIRIPISQCLEQIPEIYDLADITHEDLFSAPSSSLGPPEWIQIAQNINKTFHEDPTIDGIVLTHGTGTLEETAYFLHLTVKSSKPVVITGSMRPITALGTDSHLNLYDAVMVAACPHSAKRGVLICLNNQIHSARDGTKSDPLRPETFKSFDLGLLGYADSDHKVLFYRKTERQHTLDTPFDISRLSNLPRVDIVPVYAGVDGRMIEAACSSDAKGIVVAGIGGGSGQGDFEAAALKSMEMGVKFVYSSRTPTGRSVPTPKRQALGFIFSDNLLPQKARVLLMLALTVSEDQQTIQSMFDKM